MRKRLVVSLILAAFLCGFSFAHSGKPKYHVIIDTDGAIDDMRAISMLLSGNDIRVLALTCSQGTLLPETVFIKVCSLLAAFHHEGIPVGISEETSTELPPWASFAAGVNWADEINMQDPGPERNSIRILNRTIETYPDKITLIALGSLKTYGDWLKQNRNAAEKIERIIWYNDHSIEEGFNHGLSPESYTYIKQSGIRLDIVAGNTANLMINRDYLNHLHSSGSIYASRIEAVHAQPTVVEKIDGGHLHLWDDLVPLYLTVPVFFDLETDQHIKYASMNLQIPPGFVYESIGALLESANVSNNRVFKAFPVDTALYITDYASMLNRSLEKFGIIEWKAISMTNEIHGHTGIYSIIGAKMGIRAMEYFNVGVNNLQVVTFAGNMPPLSCFNDGIQISSGATIGQGLITVSDSVSAIPSAIFEFNNNKVNIAVKQDIAEQMQKEIGYGVSNYGLQSDAYWLYIEELAIKYWAEFDRHDIFVIKNCNRTDL